MNLRRLHCDCGLTTTKNESVPLADKLGEFAVAKSDFGPWVVDASIGEGGMGHVFKVTHKETETIGALKRLKNSNRRQRFLDEVQALSRIEHPGVVRLLDSNTEKEPCLQSTNTSLVELSATCRRMRF